MKNINYSVECKIEDISNKEAILLCEAIKEIAKKNEVDIEIHILNMENKK